MAGKFCSSAVYVALRNVCAVGQAAGCQKSSNCSCEELSFERTASCVDGSPMVRGNSSGKGTCASSEGSLVAQILVLAVWLSASRRESVFRAMMIDAVCCFHDSVTNICACSASSCCAPCPVPCSCSLVKGFTSFSALQPSGSVTARRFQPFASSATYRVGTDRVGSLLNTNQSCAESQAVVSFEQQTNSRLHVLSCGYGFVLGALSIQSTIQPQATQCAFFGFEEPEQLQ